MSQDDEGEGNDTGGGFFMASTECQRCEWKGMVKMDETWTCPSCKTEWQEVSLTIPAASMEDALQRLAATLKPLIDGPAQVMGTPLAATLLRVRKLPVEVQAMLHDGTKESVRRIREWVGYLETGERSPFSIIVIRTLEGSMEAQPGDYIIRGVKGEFYPCKPDIFEKTYEVLA